MHRFPPWSQTDETAGMSQTETKQVYVFTFRLEFPAGKEGEQQHATEASAEEPEESSESHTLKTILLFFFFFQNDGGAFRWGGMISCWSVPNGLGSFDLAS